MSLRFTGTFFGTWTFNLNGNQLTALSYVDRILELEVLSSEQSLEQAVGVALECLKEPNASSIIAKAFRAEIVNISEIVFRFNRIPLKVTLETSVEDVVRSYKDQTNPP